MSLEPAAPQPAPQAPLKLAGLEGSNPLGFLAALGVLQVLGSDERGAGLCMEWRASESAWTPALSTQDGGVIGEDWVLQTLESGLSLDVKSHSAHLLARLSEDKNGSRRLVFLEQLDAGNSANRDRMDWLAALASDFAPSQETNQLQTARRDNHYKNLASIIKATTKEHLRRSLFARWDYADALANQSLHLDPGEDRRYAYQWNMPSGDRDRQRFGGMLGANRLAIEAISLFTSIPEGGALKTVGFTGNRANDTRWSWPIWSPPLSLPIIRSVLCLADLQAEPIDGLRRLRLREQGIVAVFRSSRILVQKTPNFTPAQRIA